MQWLVYTCITLIACRKYLCQYEVCSPQLLRATSVVASCSLEKSTVLATPSPLVCRRAKLHFSKYTNFKYGYIEFLLKNNIRAKIDGNFLYWTRNYISSNFFLFHIHEDIFVKVIFSIGNALIVTCFKFTTTLRCPQPASGQVDIVLKPFIRKDQCRGIVKMMKHLMSF